VRCGVSTEPLQNLNKLFGLDAPMRAFDLEADPDETHNIIDRLPKRVIDSANAKMLLWRAQVMKALLLQ
jgi:hypothetical protein